MEFPPPGCSSTSNPSESILSWVQLLWVNLKSFEHKPHSRIVLIPFFFSSLQRFTPQGSTIKTRMKRSLCPSPAPCRKVRDASGIYPWKSWDSNSLPGIPPCLGLFGASGIAPETKIRFLSDFLVKFASWAMISLLVRGSSNSCHSSGQRKFGITTGFSSLSLLWAEETWNPHWIFLLVHLGIFPKLLQLWGTSLVVKTQLLALDKALFHLEN